MRYFTCLFFILIVCISCKKPFDMKSYDQLTIENYNSLIEDISVLNEMISYDALSDSITKSQYDEQASELKLRLESTLRKLEREDLPESVNKYHASLVNLYKLYINLINHDMNFTRLDPNDVGFSVDSFAYAHDKINIEILASIDTFNIARTESLEQIKEK